MNECVVRGIRVVVVFGMVQGKCLEGMEET